jgi:hypothetical protein
VSNSPARSGSSVLDVSLSPGFSTVGFLGSPSVLVRDSEFASWSSLIRVLISFLEACMRGQISLMGFLAAFRERRRVSSSVVQVRLVFVGTLETAFVCFGWLAIV